MSGLTFTGTRKGMTDKQIIMFKKWLRIIEPWSFYHGDAIGADAEAHDIVEQMVREDGLDCQIIIYPCLLDKQRAFKGQGDIHVSVMDPAHSPLIRNKLMVSHADVVIAAPKEDHEIVRSGTWATIRYAQQQNKPLVVLYP